MVSALKDMANTVVVTVVGLRVHAIELPHSLTEIAIGSLDQQVVMVIHQAIGMD